MSRILRSLVCLLLICCILMNLSPLKAHALDPVTVGFVGVSAVVGVSCIMQALGYMAASNSEPFTNSVNACVDYLTDSTSFVTNGLLTFAGYRSGQLSSMYAMRDLVQEIWQWLFDSGNCSLNVSNQISVSNSIFGNGILKTNDPVWLAGYQDGDRVYMIMVSKESTTFSFTGDSSTSGYINKSYNGVYYYTNWGPFSSSSPSYPWLGTYDFTSTTYAAQYFIDNFYPGTGVTTASDDISLGRIQSPYQSVGTDEEIIEIEIAPVYIDLTKKVEEFPDPNNPSDDPDLDKKIPWLPIRIPSKNYDDTVINQTQQESWTGESEVEFEFDYGDSSGDGSGNTGTNTGTNTGNNSWTPSGDMQHFTLDLKEYFPFCIPFDLYDFFTCLNADPVAPVIEWVIPLPGGDTYPLELDLSTFDPVAQLLRRLQLLLFCVGLAFKTRDLIKG